MDGRMLLEHALKPIRPMPDAEFTPAPVRLGPGIWELERRLRVAGAVLPTRSTIIEIGAGELLVISAPPPPWPDLRDLGAVSTVIAPNAFHYLHAEAFAQHVGTSNVLVAPGLPHRTGSLREAEELSANSLQEWREFLEFRVINPQRYLSEVLFFHPPSRTLILTDLAFNLTRLPRAYDRVAWRMFGVPKGFGVSRNARAFLLADEAHAKAVLRAAWSWPFDRIVVAHGDVIESEARATFKSAFAKYLGEHAA